MATASSKPQRGPPPSAVRTRAGVHASHIAPSPSISAVVAANNMSQRRPVVISDDESDLDGFDSSEDDRDNLFYTPNQSPRTSLASSSIAFPSKGRSSTAASQQPRRASRKSLQGATPTQLTPANSNSSALPSQLPQPAPQVPPLPQPTTSASVLLQQQQQRVANVNRKVSAPHPPQQLRKPMTSQPRPVPSSQRKPVPAQPAIPQAAASTSKGHARSGSAPTATKTTPSSTPTVSRSSSLNKNAANTPSTSRAQPRLAKPTRITSTASSARSLSSTTLENHSDLFSGSEEILTDSTVVTSPGLSDQGKKPSTSKSSASKSTRLPATYHTLGGQQQQSRKFSYTDDDWAKDVKWLAGSIVTGSTENFTTELKRNTSSGSKRESADSKRDVKGKGKEKEILTDTVEVEDKDKKKKRRKSKTEREVVYYTATNGMPRPPPTDDQPQANGAASRNHLMTALMEEADEDSSSTADGRDLKTKLSVVMEGEEEGPVTPKLTPGKLAVVNDSPPTPRATSLALDPIKRKRSKSLGDPADFGDSIVVVDGAELKKEFQAERDAHKLHSAQQSTTSINDWALDYKSILARTNRGQQQPTSMIGSQSGYLASTSMSSSHSSFAFNSALPVANGELPSHGTPGYARMDVPRAPPSVLSHDRRPSVAGSTSGNWLKGILAPPSSTPLAPGGLANGATHHVQYPAKLDGRVDLTKAGGASLMATVEVVRGLAAVEKVAGAYGPPRGVRGFLSSLTRRRTVSGTEAEDIKDRQKKGLKRGFTISFGGSRSRKASEDVLGGRGALHSSSDPRAQAMAAMAAGRVLGFAVHQATPSFVPREGVVVQVWAVGVDGVDAKLVGLRPGKPRKDEGKILGDKVLVAEPESQEDAGRSGHHRRQNGYSGETDGEETEREDGPPRRPGRLGRSTSLRERLGSFRLKGGKKKDKSLERSGSTSADQFLRRPTLKRMKDKVSGPPTPAQPQVGFIPGRSFVGRVVETGLDVKEDYVRRNDWVIGILDAKKSGALAEYLVVDRHRVRRVPHPASVPGEEARNAIATTTSLNSYSSNSTARLPRLPNTPAASLTLEELALLPATGLQAYRAVQTFTRAFAGQSKGITPRPVDYPSFAAALNDGSFLGGRNHQAADHDGARHRRALVLRGHDGIGAMAVQLLKMRGWRVSVHIPVPGPHEDEDIQRYMEEAERRAGELGGEEVVFDDGGNSEDPWWDEGRGAAARLIDWLNADGDVYDAVLDTIGGKEIREASERLLRSLGKDEDTILPEGNRPAYRNQQKTGYGQFTTTMGDEPDRIVPTFGESFRANMRSLKGGGGVVGGSGSAGATTPATAEMEGGPTSPGIENLKGKPGYQWVGVSQDIDLQGEDVADTLGHVVRLALEQGIKPVVPRISVANESAVTYRYKDGVVPFEKTPEIFVDGDGPLSNGGTMVVKVVKV